MCVFASVCVWVWGVAWGARLALAFANQLTVCNPNTNTNTNTNTKPNAKP